MVIVHVQHGARDVVSGREVLDCAANRRFMLRSVAVGKLEVRDRKPELPSCLHSDQLGTFNSERVAR